MASPSRPWRPIGRANNSGFRPPREWLDVPLISAECWSCDRGQGNDRFAGDHNRGDDPGELQLPGARGFPTRRAPHGVIAHQKGTSVNTLLIIVGIIAIILLFTGGFVQSLNFLLWVGIVLLVLAVIVWLVRMLTGNRSV